MKTLLILFFLPLCFFSFAQNDHQALFLKAEQLYDNGDYEGALHVYEAAYQQCLAAQEWNLGLKCLIGFGYCLDDLGRQEELIARFEKELPALDETGCIDLLLMGKAWLTMAIAWRNRENLVRSLEYYEKALAHYRWFKVKGANVAYAYKNAAQIYQRHINYPKAIAYTLKGLEIDTGKDYRASLYAILANTYLLDEKVELALQAYQKGLKEDCSERELATLHATAGQIYFLLGQFDLSEFNYKKALDFYLSREDGENAAIIYIDLAELAKVSGKTSKAELIYEEAIRQVRSFSDGKNRETAKVLVHTGNYYLAAAQTNKALDYYQKAIVEAFPGFNSFALNQNPTVENIPLESWAMTSMYSKGAALLKRYEQSREIADVKNAAYCFDLALEVHQLLLQTFGFEEARIDLGESNFEKYEHAIEANYLLWQYEQKAEYLARVFQLQEQAKASVLQDAVERNKAFLLAHVPADLLQKESDLKRKMAALKVDLNKELFSATANDSILESLRAQLASSGLDYEQLIQKIKASSPGYQRLVDAGKLPQAILPVLPDNLNLVSYFWGSQWVYMLGIGAQGQSQMWRIKNDSSFQTTIDNYLNFFTDNQFITNDPAAFFAAAHQAYQVLFPEGLVSLLGLDLRAKECNLVIVPDGKLAFMPFDALLTAPYDGIAYSGAPFFIKKVNTRYSWSAALLFDPYHRENKQYRWIHIAPVFEGRHRGLPSLPFSSKEPGAIFRFSRYVAEKASVQQFYASAPYARVLHLSTHASVGSGDGEEPRIEFFEQSLFLSHLYAMRLSADLVVLSACDTHIGEVVKGEGVMSLARGFAYAGASSIVAGLWKVNESSTATLFSSFYKNLAQKKNKSVSLRAAKQKYLLSKVPNAQKSPYYWAGFVLIGKDGPVSGATEIENKLFTAISLLILGLLFWRSRQL